MEKIMKKIHVPLFSILVFIILTAGTFMFFVNNPYTQKKALMDCGVISKTNFKEEQAMDATNTILKYFFSFKKFIDYNPSWFDDDFFTTDEMLHLKDVKGIFRIVYLSFFISLLLYFILITFIKREDFNPIVYLKNGALISFISVLVIMLLSLAGFDKFFISFHKIAFKNDLWLLPANSNLIKLYPECYFQRYFLTVGFAILILTFFTLFGITKGFKKFKY